MSPERQIEKVLRAFARKRLEQGGEPLELHPATRRLLQGEVARRYRQPAAASTPARSVWLRFWPRLAWAAGLVGVVALGLLVVDSSRQRSHLELAAVNDRSVRGLKLAAARPEAASPSSMPATAPSASARVVQTLSDRSATVQEEARRALAEVQQPPISPDALREATPVSSPTPAVTRAVDSAPRGKELAATAAPATNPPALGAPLAMPGEAVAALETPVLAPAQSEAPKAAYGDLSQAAALLDKRPSVQVAATREVPAPQPANFSEFQEAERKDTPPTVFAQRFSQMALPARADRLADSPGQSVLNSFQLEQRGRNIRIVDGDGSVYTGVVELATVPLVRAPAQPTPERSAERRGTRTASRAASLASGQPGQAASPQQALTFTVRGTNTTLNQLVVFTGNMQVLPQAASPQPAPPAPGQQQRLYSIHAEYVLPQSPELSGRVRLADGREWDIRAAPTR